ncbi:hypothetical protein TCAL_03915 [Tigriopus californicus]|uniref:H15 domain-containing protein n=1 Tax=Tigriopus californicus TaxID=6832 RepID=A0A553NCD8_TIGCA|nr:heterochromatin protein 1-binding protein 3-like [Tigriopus californicus]TRY63106.1 hypothetical protein TCAL_03915 [Tigriopus californicus]
MRIREPRAASQLPSTPALNPPARAQAKKGRGKAAKSAAKPAAGVAAPSPDPPTDDRSEAIDSPSSPAQPDPPAPVASPAGTSSSVKPARQKRGPKAKAENGKTKIAEADHASSGDKDSQPAELKKPGPTPVKEAKKDPYAKLKKCLPPWASEANPGAQKKMTRTPLALFKEAFDIYADKQGVASLSSMRAFFHHETDWSNQALKKKLEKAIAANQLLLVKGKGLTGHYKLLTEKKSLQRDKITPKKGRGRPANQLSGPVEPLENHFGYIFMWATHPKEASVSIIKKYVIKHFPMLDAESALRKALEHGEADGKYKRITGKGMSGTLQLMDGADKTGQLLDDAIEDAFIAMNEPKEVSVPTLRDYLDEYHPEYRTNVRPIVLKKALDRAEARGWIDRITGKGFSGTFRLAQSYYPGPVEVWGKWFEGHKGYLPKNVDAKKVRPKFTFADEDDFTDEDEPEYIPRKRKRFIWDPDMSSPSKSGPRKKKRKH